MPFKTTVADLQIVPYPLIHSREYILCTIFSLRLDDMSTKFVWRTIVEISTKVITSYLDLKST